MDNAEVISPPSIYHQEELCEPSDSNRHQTRLSGSPPANGDASSDNADTLVPLETLMEKLQAAQFEWVDESNRWVLPVNSLEELVQPQSVRAELQRVSSSSFLNESLNSLNFYTAEICRSRKKLFAILICRWGESEKFVKVIRDLVDEGVTDSDLPFDLARPKGHEGRRQGKLSRGKDLVERIIAFENWPQRDIEDFYRDQWMLLSPVFRKEAGQIPHYDLDDRILMPFTEDLERTQRAQGGFSEVWPVRISAAHQQLYESPNPNDKNPMLAIKRLFTPHESEFMNERHILRELASPRHRHLIELLATYKFHGKYHLLFPLAQANLRNLWAQATPNQDTETYLWALEQMTGLASGLDAIHMYRPYIPYNEHHGRAGTTRLRQRTGLTSPDLGESLFARHGDIKPENILWFDDFSGAAISGCLQITDFGLTRFHHHDSRSNQDPRGIVGSGTYSPPEIPLNQPVSRSYDMWSLGCVFLEFVTWLLEGSAGSEQFGDRRMERAPDSILDDTFFSLVGDGAVLRPGVEDWIRRLHESPRCSDMLHDLLHLLHNDLLVVVPNSRISAQALYEKLSEMIQNSKESSVYLVG